MIQARDDRGLGWEVGSEDLVKWSDLGFISR